MQQHAEQRLGPAYPARRRHEPQAPSGRVLAVGTLGIGCAIAAFVLLLINPTAGLFLLAPLFGVLIWYGRSALVAPLVGYELVRLMRGRRTLLLRILYAGGLLLGLSIAYAEHFTLADLWVLSVDEMPPVSIQESARLAERFVTTFLVLQALAVLLLTPAYVSGAVVIERERRTLELLFTTHLTDGQIIVGKLAARLVFLVGVLLAGLPILSLTQVFGGVDFFVLLACFFSVVLTVCSVGSVCMVCSVLCSTVTGAMATAYCAVAVMFVGCMCPPAFSLLSPVGFALEAMSGSPSYSPFANVNSALGPPMGAPLGLSPALSMVIPYALLHGTITLACLVWATTSLRRREPEPPRLLPERWYSEGRPVGKPATPELRPGAGQTQWTPIPSTVVRPPVGNRALLWKEAHFGWFGSASDAISIIYAVIILYVFVVFAVFGLTQIWGARVDWAGPSFQPLLQMIVCVTSGLLNVLVAFRAAGAVARERDQRTLLSLLTLPYHRHELLAAKLWGAVYRQRRWLAYLAGSILLGLVTLTFHPLAVLLLTLACAAQLAFTATLGLSLSVVCRTRVQANVLTAVVLFFWYIGLAVLPLFLLTGGRGPGSLGEWLLGFALHPVESLWWLGFGWQDWHELPVGRWPPSRQEQIALAVSGVTFYVGAAVVLWLLTCVRFRREGEQG